MAKQKYEKGTEILYLPCYENLALSKDHRNNLISPTIFQIRTECRLIFGYEIQFCVILIITSLFTHFTSDYIIYLRRSI